ncbi:MAG TPA: hypothetical protein DD729_11145 [Rhodobacteraceae bacterium]|jgi:hypothetical protein|nr:hypothetical protein [Paracoccaceae bacterium]
MLRFMLLIFLLLTPTSSQAGAWLREKGSVFLSFSNTISVNSQTLYKTDSSLYLEYGLTPRMTVGFDGFLGATGKSFEAYMFLRFPVGKPDRLNKIALTFAAGLKRIPNPWGPTVYQPQVKAGISWGRGLKHGWLAADAFVIVPISKKVSEFSWGFTGHHNTHFTADFTWGYKHSDRLMIIGQLQTGKPAIGDVYAKFSPSVVWSTGKSAKSQIELGLVVGLTGDHSQSVKIGFWRSF